MARKNKKKTLGLALSAGGSRGVAHVGFLQALEEAGLRPDFVSGCSMGSVVGSCYCMGMTPEQMHDEVKKLKIGDLFDLSINPIGNGALLNSRKLRNKMYSYLGDKTFDDLKIPFRAVATDLVSGEKIVFGGQDNLCLSVVASSSMPAIFKPVRIKDMVLIDGGIRCRVPVEEVKDMGADVVVAVDALGNIQRVEKKFNLVSVLFRMVDIFDSQNTKFSIEKTNPDLLLAPDLGDMVQYKMKGMEEAFEAGYKCGVENVPKIKELLK